MTQSLFGLTQSPASEFARTDPGPSMPDCPGTDIPRWTIARSPPPLEVHRPQGISQLSLKSPTEGAGSAKSAPGPRGHPRRVLGRRIDPPDPTHGGSALASDLPPPKTVLRSSSRPRASERAWPQVRHRPRRSIRGSSLTTSKPPRGGRYTKLSHGLAPKGIKRAFRVARVGRAAAMVRLSHDVLWQETEVGADIDHAVPAMWRSLAAASV